MLASDGEREILTCCERAIQFNRTSVKWQHASSAAYPQLITPP